MASIMSFEDVRTYVYVQDDLPFSINGRGEAKKREVLRGPQYVID